MKNEEISGMCINGYVISIFLDVMQDAYWLIPGLINQVSNDSLSVPSAAGMQARYIRV